MKLNKIDLNKVAEFRDRGRDDEASLWLTKRVAGEWDFSGSRPIFGTTIHHGEGKSTHVDMDVSQIVGLPSEVPDPLQYFLAGFVGCFSTSILMAATLDGVEVQQLSASAELQLDISQAYDLSDEPPIRGLSVKVWITADADADTLRKWEHIARSQCPFTFMVTNEVEVATSVKPH